MTIEDCFIRTKDDCLAFKGMGYDNRNCENITVLRTSLWSDQCCAMLFGDECRADFMRNITVKDCHVLYLSFEQYPKKFLMLHAGEAMRMENLRFENIDIYGEGQDRNYIEMTCEFNQYNRKKVPGFIRNIVLKDVKVSGKDGPYTIVMRGFSEQYDIDGVTFEHCTINGKPITEKSPNVQIGGFTKNIRFIE
jgi:polygalacturonase